MKHMFKSTDVKYELSDAEVLDLYYAEPRLAALMDLGVIRWIDHHLVVGLKEFITPKTNKLTAYAKRNLPVCCVGIRYKSHSIVSCTLDILIQSTGFMEDGAAENSNQTEGEQKAESRKIADEIERLNSILLDLPGSFSGTLKAHMTRKGYTEELLAEEAKLSVSTIKQYRQKEEKEKTLKTVTAICIGLHLHPWLTEDLLHKARVFPKHTKLDSAYRYLYTFHYKDGIADCNIYLRSQGLPEFKDREGAA